MSWNERVQRIMVQNTSGERVPPYACMELVYAAGCALDNDSVSEDVFWQIKKPTAAATAAKVLFNGPRWIEISGRGESTLDSVPIALVDVTLVSVLPGEKLGPVAGSWYLKADGSGFVLKTADVSPPAYAVSGTIRTGYVQAAATLRRHWIGYLYSGFRGVVAGFWVIPSLQLDGSLPAGPQWVVNLYKWNFGISAATIRVEEDVVNERWLALQMEYVCPDDREMDPPYPPETPPPWPE